MFFPHKFELLKFRLTSEVVLIYILAIESVRVDIIELFWSMIVNQVRLGNFHIMKSHKLHSDLVFVVNSTETIVQISHLSSEVTAGERSVDVLYSSIDTPSSFVGDLRDVF